MSEPGDVFFVSCHLSILANMFLRTAGVFWVDCFIAVLIEMNHSLPGLVP